MPLFNQKPQPAPPKLNELQRRHQAMAQDHLDRASKAGRLDAETRHATIGTGHAVMALLTYLQLRDGFVVAGTAEAQEGHRWAPMATAYRFERSRVSPT